MKRILIMLGTAALALGILGIFVPLLPTTPFLLLAAWLYARSSPKLYRRLLDHKRLGPYITNFRVYRAIPLRVKFVSVSLVWATLLYCIFGVVEALWLQIGLGALALALTLHILSYKTLKAKPDGTPSEAPAAADSPDLIPQVSDERPDRQPSA